MDWASMSFNMYKSWALRCGYGVNVIEEMAGEIAAVKVLKLSLVRHHTRIRFWGCKLYPNCYHFNRKYTKIFFGYLQMAPANKIKMS
jgi:hypothetical protein